MGWNFRGQSSESSCVGADKGGSDGPRWEETLIFPGTNQGFDYGTQDLTLAAAIGCERGG